MFWIFGCSIYVRLLQTTVHMCTEMKPNHIYTNIFIQSRSHSPNTLYFLTDRSAGRVFRCFPNTVSWMSFQWTKKTESFLGMAGISKYNVNFNETVELLCWVFNLLRILSSLDTILKVPFVSRMTIPLAPTRLGFFDRTTEILAPWKSTFKISDLKKTNLIIHTVLQHFLQSFTQNARIVHR